MDKSKGKSVTTSVPSISIKFHANAEHIEELYASDEDVNATVEKTDETSGSANLGDPDSSPLKLLPKLVKRSTSIDVGQTQHMDASPPSDPWRFFSDIKGKITKSVEEKITEIKARNNEEGSPQHKGKPEKSGDSKTVKDSKENSSVSDSEDLSESSISKTCGIVSTTEGVEMSSDEETPSLDKEKNNTEKNLQHSPTKGGLRHRFRFLRSKEETEEGLVKVKDLSKLYNINSEKLDQVLPTEDADEVESAVDALEDEDLKYDTTKANRNVNSEEILQKVVERISNIELDEENVVKIKEVSGKEIRDEFFDCNIQSTKTVFAPSGHVDLRPLVIETRQATNYMKLLVIFLSVIMFIITQSYSPFLGGLAIGIIMCFLYFQIYLKLHPLSSTNSPSKAPSVPPLPSKILEVQAVKEYQPLQKFEGWVNEYPDTYSPETYHISRTQSVYLRLQGNLLRLSHSRTKVPKRAMWNEPEIVPTFTHHRIYNLIGARITLLPEGLAKKRHWSKKYPICVTLSKDQMCFDSEVLAKLESEDEKNHEKDKQSDKEKQSPTPNRSRKSFSRFRKKEYPGLSQRFSKLTEDNFDMDSDSRASTPSVEFSDVPDSPVPGDEDLLTEEKIVEVFGNLPVESCLSSSPPKTDPSEIVIYLFGRTDREKEDWFRRLTTATHKEMSYICTDSSNIDIKDSLFDPLVEAAQTEMEYLKYMNAYKPSSKSRKLSKDKTDKTDTDNVQEEPEESKQDLILWLNSLIGRVLFDCFRDPNFIGKVKDRIQRKLSTIKLPYFIEELLIPELSLGKTPPSIKKTGKPVMDDRGLWIDLDIAYEGLIILTLQTKLNLMRLKNPQAYERPQVKSAIYHSDVDDSAESSSDEEGPQEVSTFVNDSNSPVAKASESGGKKFIRMVDKIAESKIFKVATDNRYIKKAMEGVSNTDLRLTVEVKSIVGTLVINIPPPPSDRIWLGFRPVPEISLSARPIVGERHVSYMIVTNWIEKKLVEEFQKVMVIPNMEDFVIPVMNPKLPE